MKKLAFFGLLSLVFSQKIETCDEFIAEPDEENWGISTRVFMHLFGFLADDTTSQKSQDQLKLWRQRQRELKDHRIEAHIGAPKDNIRYIPEAEELPE